ncbi:MAG: hypothetical protein MUO21_02735 [Nitrososphaeraceae archaeon]|nr:hypothetical protein [Nitrososphaeraceae archaeon]
MSTVSNQPKSLLEILRNISGPTGHRCEALSKDSSNSNLKQKFFEACDTLDNNYKNIHKFYKHGMFYLMYSDKSSENINLEQYYNDINYDCHNGDYSDFISVGFSQDVIMDYFLKNINGSVNNKYSAFVKDYLSRCTIEDAQKIFEQYDFDPEKQILGTNFLQIAKNNKNVDLIEYLSKKKYSGKITKLKADNLILKKNNTVLLLKNNNLEAANRKMKKELSSMSVFQWMPIGILVAIIVVLFGVLFR